MDLQTQPRPRSRPVDRVLCAASAAVLLAACVGAWRARGEVASARASLAAVQAELRQGDGLLRSLEGRGVGEADRLARRVALNAEAPLTRILADLTRLMPEDVRLRSLDVRYADDVSVAAQVEARSVAAWDAFLERLAASGRFARVVPGPETRDGELRVEVRMLFVAGAS
jgi:Tfp pilus assembly protein PilN